MEQIALLTQVLYPQEQEYSEHYCCNSVAVQNNAIDELAFLPTFICKILTKKL